MIDLAVVNASQIVTCAGRGPPLAGPVANELHITKGGVAIEGERIVEVGPGVDERDAARVVDARGGVVLPGFVDCHTHAVFSGSRAGKWIRSLYSFCCNF